MNPHNKMPSKVGVSEKGRSFHIRVQSNILTRFVIQFIFTRAGKKLPPPLACPRCSDMIPTHSMFDALKNPNGVVPTLRNLRRFAMVVECASLATAAKKLGSVDSSNLRKEIDRLEDSLGYLVFNRIGDKMTVTPRGRDFYHVLLQFSNDLQALADNCADPPDTLKIGAASGDIQWLINPRISLIKELLPNVKLNLKDKHFRKIHRGLQKGTLDFAITDEGHVFENSDALQGTPLDPIEFALYIPSNLQTGAVPSSDLLASIPFATLGRRSIFTKRLKKAAKHAGFKLRFETYYGRIGALYQSLSLGLHAAVLPTIAHEVQPLKDVEVHTSPAFLKDLTYIPALVWRINAERAQPWLEKTASTLHKGLTLPIKIPQRLG
jgi:DNA-binding transcriptional LysR family regulator